MFLCTSCSCSPPTSPSTVHTMVYTGQGGIVPPPRWGPGGPGGRCGRRAVQGHERQEAIRGAVPPGEEGMCVCIIMWGILGPGCCVKKRRENRLTGPHHTPTHDTTTPIPHILHPPTAGAGDVRHRLPLHAQAVGEGARRQDRRPAAADAQGRPARAGGTRSRSHARSIPFFDGKHKTAPPGDSVLFCSVPCSQPSKSSTPKTQTPNRKSNSEP